MKFDFLIQRDSIDARAASSSRVSSFSSPRLMRERSLPPSSVTQRGVDCLVAFAFGRNYRVVLVVLQLGLVDFDFQCSTILLGQKVATVVAPHPRRGIL